MKISFFPVKGIKKYKFSYLKYDIISAISICLLTIPQSIAYSLLAGLPPSSGLFAAIFGSIFVGAFGSSKYLISGPTTAVAILLQTSISAVLSNYFPGAEGQEREILTLNILAHIVFIMGVLQIIFGLFNMGKVLQFVSRSVVLGYFAGVVIAILVNQLYPFLGIENEGMSYPVILKFWNLIFLLNKINIYALAFGLFGIFLLIFLKRKFKKIPNVFIMIIVLSGLNYFMGHFFDINLESLKSLQMTIFPKMHFHLDIKIINMIFPSALAITLLGILEVFSVSKALSIESQQRVNYNQQIYSIGIANFFLSFIFGAMPTSASISRSLYNYRSSSKSKFCSIMSGVFVFILVFFGFELLKYIPLVGLSAILIYMVPKFLDYRQIKFCFKVTKADAIVFLLTMISCLLFSLSIAFFIGIALSIAFYLKRAAIPHVVEYTFTSEGRLIIISRKKKMHRKVRIIGIAGELFFASVDLFQNTLQKVAKDPYVEVIILRLNNVYYMDASMCYAILKLHEYLKKGGRYLLISGITEEIAKIFLKASLVKKIGSDKLFFTDESRPQLSTWHACMRAKDLIKK